MLKNIKTSQKMMLPIFLVLIISFSLIILLTYLTIGYFVTIYYQNTINKKEKIFIQEIDNMKKNTTNSLKWLSGSIRLINAINSNDKKELLSLVKLAMDSFDMDYLIITDKYGYEIVKTFNNDTLKEDTKKNIFIQKALKGEIITGINQTGQVKLSLISSSPIKDKTNTIVGTLSIGYTLNSPKFVDNFKNILMTEVTVFQNNIRLMTTIFDKDGKRIIGTTLGNPNIENEVLIKGQTYYGKSTIKGFEYLTSYLPIFSIDNKIIGMFFIGEKMDIVKNFIFYFTIFVAILLSLIMFVIISITKRIIITPLNNIKETVKSIEILDNENKKIQIDYKNIKDEISTFELFLSSLIKQLHTIITSVKKIISDGYEMGSNLATNSLESSSTIEEISRTMNSMNEKTGLLYNEIQESTSIINKINKFINNVVTLIEKQSTSVNQSSASIEEMMANIGNIAKSMKNKKILTDELSVLAKMGDEKMQNMVLSIDDINKSTELIISMIKVINDITEQTNLLAMNASIEAAHAGEYGKGFSVVANEIRNLAEATRANAKNISSSLKTIIEKIRNTENVSKETNETINQIIKGTGDISNSINEMLTGMSEMVIGTHQITEALMDLKNITEEVLNSSKDMSQGTEQINTSINKISKMAEENKTGITEITSGVNEISKTSVVLSDLSNSNSENMGMLEKEINKIKIKL